MSRKSYKLPKMTEESEVSKAGGLNISVEEIGQCRGGPDNDIDLEAVFGGRISGPSQKGLKVNPLFSDGYHSNNHFKGAADQDINGNMNNVHVVTYETFPKKRGAIMKQALSDPANDGDSDAVSNHKDIAKSEEASDTDSIKSVAGSVNSYHSDTFGSPYRLLSPESDPVESNSAQKSPPELNEVLLKNQRNVRGFGRGGYGLLPGKIESDQSKVIEERTQNVFCGNTDFSISESDKLILKQREDYHLLSYKNNGFVSSEPDNAEVKCDAKDDSIDNDNVFTEESLKQEPETSGAELVGDSEKEKCQNSKIDTEAANISLNEIENPNTIVTEAHVHIQNNDQNESLGQDEFDHTPVPLKTSTLKSKSTSSLPSDDEHEVIEKTIDIGPADSDWSERTMGTNQTIEANQTMDTCLGDSDVHEKTIETIPVGSDWPDLEELVKPPSEDDSADVELIDEKVVHATEVVTEIQRDSTGVSLDFCDHFSCITGVSSNESKNSKRENKDTCIVHNENTSDVDLHKESRTPNLEETSVSNILTYIIESKHGHHEDDHSIISDTTATVNAEEGEDKQVQDCEESERRYKKVRTKSNGEASSTRTLKSILANNGSEPNSQSGSVKGNGNSLNNSQDEIQELKSVKFTEDTVFHENKTRKYKKERIERIQLRDIYRGKISSSAAAKLNPLFKDEGDGEGEPGSMTDDEKMAYQEAIRKMMSKPGSVDAPTYAEHYLILKAHGLKESNFDIEQLPREMERPAYERLIQRTLAKERRKLMIKWTLVILTVGIIVTVATVLAVYLKA